jgi:hypothetical protein
MKYGHRLLFLQFASAFLFLAMFVFSLSLSLSLSFIELLKSTVCKARSNNAGQEKISFVHLWPENALTAAKAR